MPDVVRPCVLLEGGDVMPHPMSSDRVCCPMGMMACHARRRSTVYAVQRRLCHATPDVVDRVCGPKEVMSCHARSRPIVCVVQER